MNWVGNLIQKEIEPNYTILDLGCGIMQATLDHVPSYPKTRLRCNKLIGLDVYEPYLKFLNKRYPEIDTIKWDLRNIPLPFKDKSHDAVLLTDILEHLETIPQVEAVLEEAERIAKKMIFVLTPNIFWKNEQAIDYHNLGENKFELHKLLITEKFLKVKGFKTNIYNRKYIFGIKKTNLKILHIWDVAGVAGCLSKYQKKLGHDVKILLNKEYDPYLFRDIYRYECLLHKPMFFKKRFIGKLFGFIDRITKFLMMFIFIKKFNPNIIHFHTVWDYPLLFPFRKKLVEFHGTELRRKLANGNINHLKKTPKWIFKLYKIFKIPYFVSTEDLLKDIPKNKIPIKEKLISNPVDVELFSKNLYNPINKNALYSSNHYENVKWALNIANKNNLKLKILYRVNKEYFEYRNFPKFLSQFEYYIDRYNIESLSKTALESLYMGLKVIRWDGKIIDEFPIVHDPYNVAQRTIEIYRKILDDGYEL